jgi:hypothetical protein
MEDLDYPLAQSLPVREPSNGFAQSLDGKVSHDAPEEDLEEAVLDRRRVRSGLLGLAAELAKEERVAPMAPAADLERRGDVGLEES